MKIKHPYIFLVTTFLNICNVISYITFFMKFNHEIYQTKNNFKRLYNASMTNVDEHFLYMF